MFVAELAPSCSAIEFPVDLDRVPVHSTVPCSGLAAKRSQVRDPPSAEALPREEADFDFRLVEPTSVFRGEVNREAVPNLAAHLPTESVRE